MKSRNRGLTEHGLGDRVACCDTDGVTLVHMGGMTMDNYGRGGVRIPDTRWVPVMSAGDEGSAGIEVVPAYL